MCGQIYCIRTKSSPHSDNMNGFQGRFNLNAMVDSRPSLHKDASHQTVEGWKSEELKAIIIIIMDFSKTFACRTNSICCFMNIPQEQSQQSAFGFCLLIFAHLKIYQKEENVVYLWVFLWKMCFLRVNISVQHSKAYTNLCNKLRLCHNDLKPASDASSWLHWRFLQHNKASMCH